MEFEDLKIFSIPFIAVMITETLGFFVGPYKFYMAIGLQVAIIFIIFIYLRVMDRYWPIDVTIYETRQGGLRVKRDKAVRIKTPNKLGYEHYWLRKKKQSVKPPIFEHMQIMDTSRSHLSLVSPQYGEYSPIKVNNITNELEPTDKEIAMWTLNNIKNDFEMFKQKPESAFQKYGTFILAGAIIVLIAMFGILSWISLPAQLSTMSHIADQNLEYAKAIQQAINSNPAFPKPQVLQ